MNERIRIEPTINNSFAKVNNETPIYPYSKLKQRTKEDETVILKKLITSL